MSIDNSIYKNLKQISWLLVVPLMLSGVITSCGDDITSPNEKLQGATGAIKGEVFDKASGNALSGVQVTVVDTTGDSDAEWTATTGENGVFTIEDIPVTADAKSKAESGGYSNPYTLHLDASSLENYRDSYKARVDVVFESTGGDGAVTTDIISKVKLPLSEQAVTVSGKAHTYSGKIISGATVELYQRFNPIINGNSSTQTNMLVATGETGDDGSFTFEGVEEDASVYFKFIDKSDPANVIDRTTPTYQTPAGSESNASMDLGVVQASEENRTGAFYVTNITPSSEANIGKDQEFMYVFNRPVAENPYTDASASFGVGSMKDDIEFQYRGDKSFKSPGDVEFTVSWNGNRDTLSIEPEVSTMKDGSEYRLQVDAFDDDRFVDGHGNKVSWSASNYDEFPAENLTFFTNFNTKAPHTVELAVDSTGNHPDTDWDSGQHTLKWNMNDDPAEVKEYEIFISRDGGAYQHLATKPADDANHGELTYNVYGYSNPNFTDNISDQPDWFDGYSTLARLLITNEDDLPLDEAHTHKIKVRAISKNLVEGEFSNEITVEDVVKPDVFDVDRGAAGNNNDDKLYVKFTEPLKKGLAEDASNYTINDGNGDAVDATINSIEYAYEDIDGPEGTDRYELVITVDDTQDLDDGVELEVSTDVTDLTGNGMDAENDANIESY